MRRPTYPKFPSTLQAAPTSVAPSIRPDAGMSVSDATRLAKEALAHADVQAILMSQGGPMPVTGDYYDAIRARYQVRTHAPTALTNQFVRGIYNTRGGVPSFAAANYQYPSRQMVIGAALAGTRRLATRPQQLKGLGATVCSETGPNQPDCISPEEAKKQEEAKKWWDSAADWVKDAVKSACGDKPAIACLCTLPLASGLSFCKPPAGAAPAAGGFPIGPAGTQFVASEQQPLPAFAGEKIVYYGYGSAFTSKKVPGGTLCNNATFGDPARGTDKACFMNPADLSASPAEQGISTKTIAIGAAVAVGAVLLLSMRRR